MNIEKLLNVKATILVTGESGSGKSHWSFSLAQRREKSLNSIMTVDLAALSDNLVESELFGHERGAFTGAFSRRIGLCEQVGSGTLILDEIGELSLESQKKLLTLLERRVFRPVGSNREIRFRGRVIAATNRDLLSMVKKGEFREDLYYRLRVFHNHVPPFRCRTELEKRDIIRLLIIEIMENYKLGDKPIFSLDAKSYLLNYRWSGNIRQLRHTLEFLMVMYPAEKITVDMVKSCEQGDDLEKEVGDLGFNIGKIPYAQVKASFEKSYLIESLRYTGGIINQTAILIGMNKSTLISKIRQYKINVLEFKNIPKMERVAS